MITPNEFVAKWDVEKNGKLIKFTAEILENINIDDESKEFLIAAGLPASASPFLEFMVFDKMEIPTASQLWGIDEKYSKYRCIGSTGSGDPICIIESKGNIVYLNHDDGFKEVFINTSIPQLAESLLVYAQLVEETMKENGEEAFLDNNIPERLKDWVVKEINRIDIVAIDEYNFWGTEIETL
jgi:hypothetical protein